MKTLLIALALIIISGCASTDYSPVLKDARTVNMGDSLDDVKAKIKVEPYKTTTTKHNNSFYKMYLYRVGEYKFAVFTVDKNNKVILIHI